MVTIQGPDGELLAIIVGAADKSKPGVEKYQVRDRPEQRGT